MISSDHSQLYWVASRYFLPTSLILLCLSIDLKGILRLGPKALIMFFTATLGIIADGPIALLLVIHVFPSLLSVETDQLWKAFSTVAGSWIGGGANQAAMKEIFQVGDDLFASMVVIDVVVANLWLGFLLYGASITQKIDRWLDGDTTAIEDLRERVASYRAQVARIPDLPSLPSLPSLTSLTTLLAVAFGGVTLAHWGADTIVPWMESCVTLLARWRLHALASPFFWMILIATTVGVLLSLTKARRLEGAGASTCGSLFLYLLVATIGMKMNLAEIGQHLGLFTVGLLWMSIHVLLLLIVAKLIRAPFFFVAVGSQANVGGGLRLPPRTRAGRGPHGRPRLCPGHLRRPFCAYLMQFVSAGG